jgi:hypothetical protein
MLIAVTGCLGLAIPAVAAANDSASVVNGVIVVQGDSGPNSIDYQSGFSSGSGPSPGPNDNGSEIWDNDAAATVSAGPGCATGIDPTGTGDGVNYPVVYCGSSSVTSIDVEGNGGNDTLTLNDSGLGSPAFYPSYTSVLVNGGDGDDTFAFEGRTSTGTITVNGGGGNDTVSTGTSGTYAINGDAGDDQLTAAEGNDVVHGGDGNDTIHALGGDDMVYGDAGSDTIAIGSGNDTVSGGSGTDTITGGPGNETIDVYDGERDSVACDILGNDVVNADQFDVVNTTDCASVQVSVFGSCPAGQTGTPPNCQTPPSTCPAGQTGTPPNCVTPSGGSATARPKVVAFASHCVRRHGHRVCTEPAPLRGRRYTGKASQHQSVSVAVDKHGRYVKFTLKGLAFSCSDGTDGSEDVHIAAADHQRISSRGTFSEEIDYTASDGYSHEVVYVVGAFNGHKAKGAVVGNTQIAGHGECTSGDVSWNATT